MYERIMSHFTLRHTKSRSLLFITFVGVTFIPSSEVTNHLVTTTVAFTHVHQSLTANAPLKRTPFERTCTNKILFRSSYRLYIRPYQQQYSNDDPEHEYIPQLEHRQNTERPTLTSAELIRTPTIPAKPKIVVFGASGLLGRLVVRQLLEHPQLNDATIVAFVRDYDKACRVLYDDMIVASSRRQKGAKLVIVQGDLVPPEELPNCNTFYDDDDGDDHLNDEADTHEKTPEKGIPFVDDEILRDTISDCTTIISCVGTVRITNIWTDYIVRPLYRILRPNVSDWCYDRHHPYYVHYRTLEKIIYYAEQEQLRRQAALIEDIDQSIVARGDIQKQSDHRVGATKKKSIPKIRLVRISDLCVAQPPWYLIPILMNIFHSMIFRYHYMADQLLEKCRHLDTISIRPGDIVDDERDTTTMSIQVDPTGTVPYPARISRDDTAEVIVAAALWNNRNHDVSKSKSSHFITVDENIADDKSFHYTLACRWVGDDMDPYPAQGHASDGHPTAYQCLQSALSRTHDETNSINRPKMKPYGICTALPVYLFISLFISSIFYNCIGWGDTIGKLPSLMKPILFPLKHVFSTIFTFIFGSLHYLRWIINLRSYKNVKYISF